MQVIFTFLGVLFLFLIVKYVYDTFLTNNTKELLEEYERTNPEESQRLKRNKGLNLNTKPENNLNNQQESLKRLADFKGIGTDDLKEHFWADLQKMEVSNSSYRETLDFIRQEKLNESELYNIDPDDTAQAYLEKWLYEYLESFNDYSGIYNLDGSVKDESDNDYREYDSLDKALKYPLRVNGLDINVDGEDVNHKEYLTVFPREILNMVNLKHLVLGSQGIREIPPEIDKLKRLKVLELANTKLIDLPETIGNLHELEILGIGNTYIKELPETIGKLRNLKCLYLMNTKIQKLPKSIDNLNNLEELFTVGSSVDLQEQNRIKNLFPNCKLKF
jgi:Leucine-rich repeat (LRR) protein